MDEECSKTPYNSIYEALKNQRSNSEVVCCQHGNQCPYGKKAVPVLENQYENIPSQEEQVAEKLAAKLRNLSSKRDRKKRRKTEIQEPTEDTSKSSMQLYTEQSMIQKNVDDVYSAYIGIHSSSAAESHVTTRGQFMLYHLFETGGRVDNLTAGLPLMLVYFTTTKKHRHYPIRTSKGTADNLQFSVDCGYPNVRKHCSVGQLVKYYRAFGAMNSNAVETYADDFSWWLE